MFVVLGLALAAPVGHASPRSAQTKAQKNAEKSYKKYSKQQAKQQKKQLKAQNKQMKKWNKDHQTKVTVPKASCHTPVRQRQAQHIVRGNPGDLRENRCQRTTGNSMKLSSLGAT